MLRPSGYTVDEIGLIQSSVSLQISQNDMRIHLKHEEDIEKLKSEILLKDAEIAQLKKSVEDLQEQNRDLDISLKSRTEEVRKLRGRIQTLESEKKRLEADLASVNYKLSNLEKDVKALANAKDKQDDENQKLEDDLLKVNSKLNNIKEDLDRTKGENDKLKREMKDFKEGKQLRVAGQPPKLSLPEAVEQQTEAMALVYLGQLCQQIQAFMYKAVLPEHFTHIRSYKVKTIEKDIVKLPKTEEDIQKAKQKWLELKSKLDWNENYEEAMKSLQQSRNQEAHPKLDEGVLIAYAEEMDKKGALKGWLSLQCVKELISIWKKLECGQIGTLA